LKPRKILLLTFSHFASDINQGALPAMLPIFIAQRHFSYSLAASLVLATNAMASFLQPLFGWLADRKPTPWLAPVGLVTASLGMGLAGITQSYPVLVASVALSGVGLAIFHPEAARLVHHHSGLKRSSAMSLFSVGGNAGFAAGPVLTTALLAWMGLRGSVLLVIPSAVMAPVLFLKFRHDRGGPRKHPVCTVPQARSDAWGPFSVLTVSIVFRSIVFYGLNTFLPLYWIGFFGKSKEAGSSALSLLLISGTFGTLAGGHLGDRFRRNKLIGITMAIVPFLLLAFVLLHRAGWASSLLPVLGFILFMPFSVMVVLGQEYLPNRLGTASGVTLGLAGSVGGLAAPLLGHIADRYGIHSTLVALAFVSVIAAAFSFLLRPVEHLAGGETAGEVTGGEAVAR
jgi:FSR family fosmidomycin resistance protein-like MFS transporter